MQTVEVQGPGGRVVIPEADLGKYMARGYALVEPPTTGDPESNVVPLYLYDESELSDDLD